MDRDGISRDNKTGEDLCDEDLVKDNRWVLTKCFTFYRLDSDIPGNPELTFIVFCRVLQQLFTLSFFETQRKQFKT